MLGIWTAEGGRFLAALLDTYSRLIVGWALSAYRDEALVTAARRLAFGRRSPSDDLIHHPDRGSQYPADNYLKLLRSHHLQVSMRRKGDCYDHAMMASCFSTLRAECTDLPRFSTRQAARLAVFEFIAVFYNRQRRPSSLGYLSPSDQEAAHS